MCVCAGNGFCEMGLGGTLRAKTEIEAHFCAIDMFANTVMWLYFYVQVRESFHGAFSRNLSF